MLSGGDRLLSHSFMKSAAVRLMLLGVRRFSTGGRSSSSLVGDDRDGEGECAAWAMRDLEELLWLLGFLFCFSW